jgi:hypothetical protein
MFAIFSYMVTYIIILDEEIQFTFDVEVLFLLNNSLCRKGSCLLLDRDKTKTHGLSPRANYTERATAACRRGDCQLFADRGCHVVSVTDPFGHILGFLDRSRYFSIK